MGGGVAARKSTCCFQGPGALSSPSPFPPSAPGLPAPEPTSASLMTLTLAFCLHRH